MQQAFSTTTSRVGQLIIFTMENNFKGWKNPFKNHIKDYITILLQQANYFLYVEKGCIIHFEALYCFYTFYMLLFCPYITPFCPTHKD